MITQQSLKDCFLGPLHFLLYINDLAHDLSSNADEKCFAHDTSFSEVANDADFSSSICIKPLYLDLSKQALEIAFSR